MQTLAILISTDGSGANTTTNVPSVRAGASGGEKCQTPISANTTTDVPSVRAGASGGAKWQLLDDVDFILLPKHSNGEERIWD